MSPLRGDAQPKRLHVVPGGRASDPEPPSDAALIEAFENGDRRFAKQLYRRLFGVVDATLYRIMGQRGMDHDDLVQSAFEQIVLTLARRRFAGACSLTSWAGSVTTHVALNALRSRQRERRVFDRSHDVDARADMVRTADNAELRMVARDRLERLRGHLAAMKQDKAATLVLHDVLGHDLAEIAVLTRVSVAAAQSRLVRARRELQARIEDDLDESGPQP